MSQPSPRYAPHPDAAWRQVDDHVFVITPDSRQHELHGEVELFVWTRCAERPTTEEELLTAITSHFEVDPETAATDLRSFMTHLLNARVITKIF